jgi:ubiquinone/menaquinone biosynthesis C-methylase UbiE
MKSSPHKTEAQFSSAPDKITSVKAYFDKPAIYLSRRADIRIRAEAVKHFTEGKELNRILDIGCGDGSISLPLLNPDNSLTLMDLSDSMLAIAKSRIPSEYCANVQLLMGDFMTAELVPKSYDLIICLGVLAHVDSPGNAIQKIASLLAPGGSLILEFTDSGHFVGRMTRFVLNLRHALKPPPYPVNLIAVSEVMKWCGTAGLRPLAAFRYTWWAFPWIFSQNTLHSVMRFVYGRPSRSRNGWMGNEYICHLSRP